MTEADSTDDADVVDVSAERSQSANRLVIAGVRITVGLMWLANLHWKVPPDFGEKNGGGLYKYSAAVSRHSPLGLFTWVTEQIILPNFRLFGWITLLTELALALLLLVGYRTRWVALAGAAMSVPILLSTVYYDRADEWSWAYFMMIALHAILFATDAGKAHGLDGVLAEPDPSRTRRALATTGVVALVIGVAGLWVARHTGFAGDRVALLGSDAGFTDDSGKLVRRWELKLMWFNPLWALLTIAFAASLLASVRLRVLAWVSAAGFGAMAVVVMAMQTFDYVRSGGSIQTIATTSNAAVWGATALTAGLLARRQA